MPLVFSFAFSFMLMLHDQLQFSLGKREVIFLPSESGIETSQGTLGTALALVFKTSWSLDPAVLSIRQLLLLHSQLSPFS